MINTNEKDMLDGIDPLIYKRRWYILGTLCFALLGVMLANSSINLALPRMSVDLGISQLTLTWIVNIYTLVFASLLFSAGAIGDKYGRKRALQIGSVIFTVSAVYAGLVAQSGAELIVARAIMGIGGALIMPTTLSIIDNVFPRHQRARAIAIWSGISGIGMMFGGIVSGILLKYSTWHSLFYLSAGISAIAFLVNHYMLTETRDDHGHPIDWLGSVFSVIGIFGIVYGITEAPSQGLTSSNVLLGLLGGLASIGVFVWHELRVKSPLLDMRLFKNRAFSVSGMAIMLTFLAMMGVFYSLSQLQQLILGMTPLKASISMIPMMLPMLFLAPFIPSLVKKVGARATMVSGLTLVIIAFLCMSRWTIDMNYWQMLGVMLLMIAGIATTMTPGTNILMASVPRNRAGMGSAMNDTTRELGGALGIATLGAIVSSAYAHNVADAVSKFPESVRSSMEGSLAIALNVIDKMGPSGVSLANATKTAWMDALSRSSLIAAMIVAVVAVITLVALPKHVSLESEITDKSKKE